MFKYLKPKHFIAAAAIFALTSCSQDDVIDMGVQDTNKPREIEFTIDMLSRATDRTIDNLDTIWVYADNGTTQVFDFTAFIKDQYGRFVPSEKKYWPDDAALVNFTAVYPDPAKMTITKTPGNLTLDYTASQLTSEHYDLITASKQVTKQEYNGVIPLGFNHALAQIEIQAKTGPETDFKVDAYGMGLVGLYRTGKLNLNTNTWSNLSDNAKEIIAAPKQRFDIGEEAKSLTDLGGNYYVVPQTCEFPQYNVTPVKNGGLTMRFYGMAEDKVTGAGLYGYYSFLDDEQTASFRLPSDETIKLFDSMRGKNYLSGNAGLSHISLSAEPIEFKAGTKYVFTLDVTNGIGYLAENDPKDPNGPCLPNKMSANVTVEDWTTTDFNSNAN